MAEHLGKGGSQTLSYYLEAWNLSNPQPLAETATSHVYTALSEGERVILKLLKPVGEEERKGALALRYFDGQGAVRLLREDENAHLLEYADGQDLTGMVKAGDDEGAAIIIAGVINQLHSVGKAPPEGLTPLKRWFQTLFAKADQDARAGVDSVYRRAAPLALFLLDHPQEQRVLHGDIHHENIRYRAGRGWLAFDPKGLNGERTYDAANTLLNPVDSAHLVLDEARLLRISGILARELAIDRTRVLAFGYVYACLSASWTLEDSDDPAEADEAQRVAEMIEPHLRLADL